MSMLARVARRLRRPRITYANVASTLALFMALSGVAWAATLPKNSVGHKQIKKNAVRSSEINRNAVSTSEIKSNSVKGDEVDEGSLGKVPSASSSDTVGTDAGPVAVRVASSASAATEADARAAAAEIPLLTVGQITLYGKCFVETTGNFLRAEVIARTSADGAIGISTEDQLDGDPYFLNTGTAEDLRHVDTTAVGIDDATSGGDDRAAVIGPDGNGIAMQVNTWVKHGTIPESSPFATATDQCYFSIVGKRLSPPS